MVSVAVLFAVPVSHALPKKIDPTKISPASGQGVMRPVSMSTTAGSPFANARIIRVDRVRTSEAREQRERAAIEVRETRSKDRVTVETRTLPVEPASANHRGAGDMRASIPRIDADRFARMVRDYEDGRIPADSLLREGAADDRAAVSIDDINKFASPRHTLEAQGIPVYEAGGGEDAAKTTTAPPDGGN